MGMQKPWLAHYPQQVRAELEYPEVPLFQLLDQTAAQHPELSAIHFFGRKLTYRELAGAVNRCANLLISLGVAPGDRVALMMPNCPQYVIAYYGILKAGAIVVQANPLYTERELEYLMNNSGAKVIAVADICYPRVAHARAHTGLQHVLVSRLQGAEFGPEAIGFDAALQTAPAHDPGVAVSPRTVAVLQYTGGTTGVSKGAMLTHQNLVANATQVTEWFKPYANAPGAERVLTVLPLFHVYGMTCCMNYSVLNACEMILLPRFDLAEVMETIKATRPTAFPGVPTMYVAVNSYPGAEAYGMGSIRTCNSGGAAMPVEVMRAFEARFGAKIAEGYGLSEASPVTHCNPLTGLRKPGSIGLVYPDTDVRIVDIATGTQELPVDEVGELIIKGPQVMAGYWNMPDETARTLREFDGDTWLYTGDIARMDEDGFFYITDRKKDMIIASGYNVYPREVEEVLYACPGVVEAAVAGVPDRYRGETVKAYVVIKPGSGLTEADLDAHCRQNLAPYKVPKLYELRDSLPKTAVGKILRRTLVDEERRKLADSPQP